MKIDILLETLRIKHYIKNSVIILPLLFSMNFLAPNLWAREFFMIIGFCFISSVVYIMNDLIDIKKDRLHPIKSKRPIASGNMPKRSAYIILAVLLILSLIISYKLNYNCMVIIISYFLLNVLYSIYLKKFAIIDAACIAIGFILRIVAGCFAISVLPSPLVILMTFFVSMFFTCMKRKLELQVVENHGCARNSVKELDLNTINQFILINVVLSISFYLTYMLDTNTIARAGTKYLYLTSIPFTLIIYRLFLLVNTKKIADDPIHYLEKDKTLKWLFLFYILVLIFTMTVLK